MKNKFKKRLKRHIKGRLRKYFAITSPGFEHICRKELIEAGIIDDLTKTVKGGVSFQGKFIDCLKANLYLRTAIRILMRISKFKATNFGKLEKETEKIPWELFLPQETKLNIKVSSNHSRLYHKEAISEHIINVISNNILTLNNNRTNIYKQTLFVRIIDDNVSMSLDSTGQPLYKRGLKGGRTSAPIRETTASFLLSLMKVDVNAPLIDPMCGSGTFSLEAAMKAKNMLPGLIRDFAFMEWPAFQNNQWQFLKKISRQQIKSFKQPIIYASDKNKLSCKSLKKRIITHNMGDIITVYSKNFFDLTPTDFPEGPGTIIINPPYGIRIGSKKHSKILFNKICLHTKKFKKWKIGLIAPPNYSYSAIPIKLDRYPIINGGLKLNFFFGKIL